ncbi:uncharacterized protein LOC118190909 isoform X2 [Stegodyphus dumicola]|uniref:uncharacterized protein LOC118190909 isoform X2 n=1 Tax=Stegodyphus dumicola TaxID=202533 RepID=UPI0015AE1842|nr:uncharacterized protein LOC118190909 isoform X2 [Stegodyphus dumicola]
MSIKRWRPEITIKFIEEYAKYPNLWDPAHQEYKKAEMRIFSLKQIATAMANYGIKLDVAATKLPVEVTKYCEESDDSCSVTEDLASGEAVIEFLQTEEKASRGITEEKTETADYLLTSASIHENDPTPRLSSQKPSESSLSSFKTKVKKFHPNSEQHTDVSSSYAELQSSSSWSGEDEFELFGRSLASQMRQLPLVYALELEAEIQNLIVQKRLKVLRKTTEKAARETTSVISSKRPVLCTVDISKELV